MTHPLFDKLSNHEAQIAIVGLGYVGLPLACLLAKKYKIIGFDIDQRRVAELTDGIDKTKEVEDPEQLRQGNLRFSCMEQDLKQCQVFIVAVPTPIDRNKKPDLTPLMSATDVIARNMTQGSLVIYESTVYPGLTENECKAALEKISGLKHGDDFFLGYSPERVNPGDKVHTIEKVVKVVSGCCPDSLEIVDSLYSSVMEAGTHRATTIATAEAAKVIENTQRDLNIALINELSQIFARVGLDTNEVLDAAGTKWNFLKFKPGLVGGHCIGVDPYYLTHLAEGLGYLPQVILAGRRINDGMGQYIAENTIKMMLRNGIKGKEELRVAVCGVTFKEDVPDLRNTKVVDIINTLEDSGVKVYCVDPVCNPEDFKEHFGLELTSWEDVPTCDAVVLAVKHKELSEVLSLDAIKEKLNPESPILIDVKAMFSRQNAEKSGLQVWRI